jgi:hypothetical protein
MGWRDVAEERTGARARKKIEIQNPKSETNQKFEVRITKAFFPDGKNALLPFWILEFGFISDFDIRVSNLFLGALHANGDVGPAGKVDFATLFVAVKIISFLLQSEYSRHCSRGHVPGIQNFSFEFHAILNGALSLGRFGKSEFPRCGLCLPEVYEIIFARLAAVFRILPLINRLNSFRRAVFEDLAKEGEAGRALAAENPTFGPPKNVRRV